MQLKPDTRIAAILKHHPQALERIISISPKFEKLRNPFLRKLMAGRVSVSMAAKIGGCRVEDFFEALTPLGFNPQETDKVNINRQEEKPACLQSIPAEQIIELDVRPILNSGRDPLKQILQKVKELKAGEAFKLINSFEPTPLINLLEGKGYKSYVDASDSELVVSWFYKESAEMANFSELEQSHEGNWGKILKRFSGNIEMIDVRNLEMPQPMIRILEALDKLPAGKALFVHHKRIPVFLIPELEQRKFEFRSREISTGEVHLLIFKS